MVLVDEADGAVKHTELCTHIQFSFQFFIHNASPHVVRAWAQILLETSQHFIAHGEVLYSCIPCPKLLFSKYLSNLM